MPNKARERFYLRALQLALPQLPSGLPLEPEPPDFVLLSDGYRLGIEFTTFHLPSNLGDSPHQEQQSLKDRIVAQAKRLHAEAGGAPLYVTVHFNSLSRLWKKDIHPFARELADAVLAGSTPNVDDLAVTTMLARPDCIISVRRIPNGAVHKLWYAADGGWVAPITSEHISEEVRRKARSEPAARKECDDLWLVIVNDNFAGAAQAEISDEALNAMYNGPFEQLIWLLPHAPRAAIDLKLAKGLLK
jgi:hypothetical protein